MEIGNPITRLIESLTQLPGIGRRSAERIAFHMLKAPRDDVLALSRAIADVKEKVRPCSICANLTEADPCAICADDRRDASVVLVVEQPRDLVALEQTGSFRGVYHVLGGRIDPLAGVEADELTVGDLLERVRSAARNCRGVAVREVVLGLNPDLEGDSTALEIAERLKGSGVTVTRLARGLPSGSQLEYVSRAVLMDAIHGRHAVDEG